MELAQVLKIMCTCGVIYIILIPFIAVWAGRRLHDMAQPYPPVGEDNCD